MMELIYFIIGQSIYWGLISFKFYTAAGRQAWEAFIPFYNLYVLLGVADRPKWWFFLCMVPVAGTVMAIVIIYELLHMYKFRKTTDTVLVVATLGLYLGYLNYTAKLERTTRDNGYIKANLGEFVNAVFFAIVAATIIRSTTFEAYTIPTSSMEKSLMVGDFLFVSKLHYGVRLPMTPISIPFMHNKIPFTNTKSYVDFPRIPYFRFPAFQKIKNNDVVVFNWPADLIPPKIQKGELDAEVVYPPIDKKENYVKRCIGIAGDSLEIKDRIVFVNGEEQPLPDRSLGMFRYVIEVSGQALNKRWLKDKLDVNLMVLSEIQNDLYKQLKRRPTNSEINAAFASMSPDIFLSDQRGNKNIYLGTLPYKKLEILKSLPNVDTVYPVKNEPHQAVFPNPQGHHDTLVFKYSIDNFGPIYIPKEGATVDMNYENYLFYKEIITTYEGHTLETKEGKYFIDGQEATSYTFAQNYYWMMGDNRHNSEDSRYWGYVPEDHIVGKPVFIWMSLDKFQSGFDKIRTDRVFTTVHGEGERKSYFWPVAIIALLGYGFNKWRKKKKAAKQ